MVEEKSEPVRINSEYMDAIRRLMKTHKEISKESNFVNEAVAIRLVNYGVGLR